MLIKMGVPLLLFAHLCGGLQVLPQPLGRVVHRISHAAADRHTALLGLH